MALSGTLLSTDADNTLEDCTVSLSIGGVDCGAASRGTISKMDVAESYGSAAGYQFSVWFNRGNATQVAATPKETKVTVDGTVYRLMEPHMDSLDQLWRLDLKEVYP